MVSGITAIGGIAALIADADRYLLATYYQENLKYVRRGQSVEVALDLYPGQIFAGKVDSIWRGNGMGQYLPSDEIPKFQQPPPNVAQGQYAVKILWMTLTSRTSPSAHRAVPRSTPAGNTAPGLRCERSRSAPIRGSIGSTRSMSEAKWRSNMIS